MTMQSQQSQFDVEDLPVAGSETPHTGPPRGARLRILARRPQAYERVVKPCIDRVVAAGILVLVIPVLLLTAIAVLVQLGRPILLKQARIGRDGHPFGMYKFRTMTPDRRAERRAAAWDGVDRRVVHKSADDPRLVPVGRLLRAWSLDELPQLLNVLRGEMSLVGPRPEMVAIVERYAPWQHGRHAVKPGMTGLWQVTERGSGRLMHERTDIDLQYIAQVSFRTDLKILLRTLPAALGQQKGA